MRTATLPSTDLDVSAICLGTSDIGSKIERRRSFRMLDQFLELGGTFIDTASVYANWLPGPESISEKTIGEWLSSSGKRDRVVLVPNAGWDARVLVCRCAPTVDAFVVITARYVVLVDTLFNPATARALLAFAKPHLTGGRTLLAGNTRSILLRGASPTAQSSNASIFPLGA